jgi:hypothetical protein
MNAGNATLTGGQYFTYGGTANAITLTAVAGTSAPTAYVAGMMVRFRATASNTGATTINVSGLGVKTVRTITNVACPSGYIRTGIDTVAVYDGTNFIAQREIERGSNANGGFVKYADGTLVCNSPSMTLVYGTSLWLETIWVFPSVFIDSSYMGSITYRGNIANHINWSAGAPYHAATAMSNYASSQVLLNMYSLPSYPWVSTTQATDVRASANGKWY